MEADRHRGHGGDGGGGTAGTRPKEDAVADGELSEDEKMEKFYELIRKHKEIQDLQRMERERTSTAMECKDGGGDDIEWEMRRKRMKVGDREQSSWIPAFKWEDFTEYAKVEFQRPPATLPASNFSDDGKTSSMHVHVGDSPPSVQAETSGGGLDLKLGL